MINLKDSIYINLNSFPINIDVIHWSITLILNNSIACSNSEKAVAISGVVWFHLIWLNGQFSSNFILLLLVFKFIDDRIGFNSSVIKEHVESALSDWDHVFQDIP